MELQFELSMTFDEGGKTFLGHEPNNDFVAYFMNNKRIGNIYTQPNLGDFTDLTFHAEPRRMTPHPVKDFGIKSFPRFGAYGFYTPLYTPGSIMVFPINAIQDAMFNEAPGVVITDTGTTMHVVITSDYECHRIVVRQGYFAEEFVTYDTEFDFTPMYDGECTISVIGHSNEIAVTSLPYETTMTLINRT